MCEPLQSYRSLFRRFSLNVTSQNKSYRGFTLISSCVQGQPFHLICLSLLDFSFNQIQVALHCRHHHELHGLHLFIRSVFKEFITVPFWSLHMYIFLRITLTFYIQGLRIKSWQHLFLARLINHEETWKYTNGSKWCQVLLDV